ncbi:MAG TPA: cytochrome c oxidase accessory protein CcoG [bacterium]|nr:cytochrome c oxidase accessory protein CcoG [bacterium]
MRPPSPPERSQRPAESSPSQPGSGPEHEAPQHHPPERLTTLDERGNRLWVYPAAITGVFMHWRKLLGYFVIAVFFVMPWVRIGGMQSILLQIPERRFILFGHIFWPQDVFYLVYLLLGMALALFFFTAVAGRVWCGWLCPQTVFMEEIFRKLEEWVEGDHHERRRLDGQPWSVRKARLKLTKHALFLLFSALVSNTFIAYFVGTERLLHWMTESPLDHWTAFLFMAAILGVFYFDFAWFREQFCIVLCPYARFQSVLTDAHTIQVGYDVVRGEPRGRLGTVSGDCVDCLKCVAVCPTGIDIRDGYQLECIGCVRCIDACDSIMDRVGKSRGLIRYDSLARLSGERTHILRPRVLVYSVLLVGVVVALFVGLSLRPHMDLTVVRPPGDPFMLLPGGLVSNRFTVVLHNRALTPKTVRIVADGPPHTQAVVPVNPLTLKADEEIRTEAFVNIPAGEVDSGKAPVRIRVYEGPTPVAEQSMTFLAPEGP